MMLDDAGLDAFDYDIKYDYQEEEDHDAGADDDDSEDYLCLPHRTTVLG